MTAASELRGPVRGLMNTNAGILVQGQLAGKATLACGKCCPEPVITVPLASEIEELFLPTIDLLTGRTIAPEEEDQALWIDEHHILTPTEVVRQNVLLAAPLNAVCQASAAGCVPPAAKT